MTRRTAFRKAFVGPWQREVKNIWLYALADAQRSTDVAVHHGMLVITHHHLNVTPSRNNLPEFMRRVHVDMSCALSTLLARERYDAPRELWDGRGPHYLRLIDAAAQASHLVYEQLNCVAAGLVEKPSDMPDYAFDFGLWKTGYLEVERPSVYFDDGRPEALRLEITPPPLLYAAFGGDLDALVHHMRRLADAGARALRSRRTRPVAGVKRITRLHPWSEPRTLRERGGEPVPTFRVGARGIVAAEQEVRCAEETTWFRVTHENVRRARRDGDSSQRFPFGTYEWSVVHRAPVEPAPPTDATVTRPGPLFTEVCDELERVSPAPETITAISHELIDQVEQAFRDEAEQILEESLCDLSDALPVSVTAGADEGDGPPASVAVRHRFDRRVPVDKTAARRMVVLRDRRRGRPSRKNADPPV